MKTYIKIIQIYIYDYLLKYIKNTGIFINYKSNENT